EFHHALQFTILDAPSFPNRNTWIHEATSTYVQYLLFDDGLLTAAREVLWHIRLYNSNLPLDSTAVYEFHYAGFIWLKFLLEESGKPRSTMVALWQQIAAQVSWDSGTEAALPLFFDIPHLADAAAEFAVWNWFACNNADGFHYSEANTGCVSASVIAAP